MWFNEKEFSVSYIYSNVLTFGWNEMISHIYIIYIYLCIVWQELGKGSIDSAWVWIGLIFFFFNAFNAGLC